MVIARDKAACRRDDTSVRIDAPEFAAGQGRRAPAPLEFIFRVEELAMPASPLAAESTDLIRRLRRVLSAVELDCECRTSLEGALNRFTSLEHRRLMRKALADARENKDQIIARLAFLAELDEVTER